MPPTVVTVHMHYEPLDDPTPEWCTQHLLPCLLVQHIAVWHSLAPFAPGPLETAPEHVVRLVGHAD